MVFGFGKPTPVKETEAEGEIERVYHEIKQSIRASGINLNFRTWAGFEKFFPVMWGEMRSLVETRAFEDAADQIRAISAGLAENLGALDAESEVDLGESQKYQIKAALRLYHYVNPKLLVFTSKVRQALAGENAAENRAKNEEPELIERGIPTKMYSMEMVAEEPEDERLAAVFEDIKETLSLSSINSDYRTLALWADYLEAVWNRLKPITQTDYYRQAADDLRELSRQLAGSLPAVSLSKQKIEDLGEDYDEILKTTEKFEQLLPSLILNISLVSLDWHLAEELTKSPFPAARRATAGGGLW